MHLQYEIEILPQGLLHILQPDYEAEENYFESNVQYELWWRHGRCSRRR